MIKILVLSFYLVAMVFIGWVYYKKPLTSLIMCLVAESLDPGQLLYQLRLQT